MALAGIVAGLALNLIKTYTENGMVGVCAPFAEDDSLIIVYCSICIFMMFRKMSFKNTAINFIAAGVPGIYMLEQLGRNIGNSIVDWNSVPANRIIITLVIYTTVIFVAGFAFDFVKRVILDTPIAWISEKCELLAEKIWKKVPFEK